MTIYKIASRNNTWIAHAQTCPCSPASILNSFPASSLVKQGVHGYKNPTIKLVWPSLRTHAQLYFIMETHKSCALLFRRKLHWHGKKLKTCEVNSLATGHTHFRLRFNPRISSLIVCRTGHHLVSSTSPWNEAPCYQNQRKNCAGPRCTKVSAFNIKVGCKL